MRKIPRLVAAIAVLTNAVFLFAQLPGSTGRTAIGSLIACSSIYQGRVLIIKDGVDKYDCTVGGATGTNAHAVECICDVNGLGGYAWRSPDGDVGGGGGVSAVTGTAPIVSSGGTTPDISCATATTSTPGCAQLSTDGGTTAGRVVTATDTRLSNARTPTAHATSHKNGGADEVATATPAANAIPKAGAGSTLAAGWIPTLNQSTSGNAATATSLASNGGNCSAGSFPLGVDASGAAETCTALPISITGTANQITASGSTGAVTLSITTNPTLPGTTTGTFTGPLTGNASTASALAANGANCSAGSAPLGVDASGAAESCTAYLPTSTTYAASVSTAGPATTATALAANGANCSAGNYPLGVDASGNAESCTADATGLGGSTGSATLALLQANGTGGSTVQATNGSANALFNSTGLLGFVALDNSHPALTFGATRTDGNGLRVSRGDNGAFQPLVVGSLQIATTNDANSSHTNVLWDVGRSENTFASGWLIGWSSVAAGGDVFANADLSLTRGVAGVMNINAGRTSNHTGWLQYGGTCVVASDQTNATTTMQTASCYNTTSGSVEIAVMSGRTYSFKCELFVGDSVSIDGAQIDFNGGTAPATNFRAQVTAFDTALNLSTQTTSLAAAASASTFTGNGAFEVHGTLTPSGNGTFQPRFAQNSHTTGTLTLAKGSNCLLWDVTP